jgi:hypothetical protein
MALYDFHARMYDPVIGRWLVPDPAEQHYSLYLAMGNNPMSMVDSDGMWAGKQILVILIFNDRQSGHLLNHLPTFLPVQLLYQLPFPVGPVDNRAVLKFALCCASMQTEHFL